MSEDHAYYQLKELIRDEMLEQSPDLAKIMTKYKALTAAKDAAIDSLTFQLSEANRVLEAHKVVAASRSENIAALKADKERMRETIEELIGYAPYIMKEDFRKRLLSPTDDTYDSGKWGTQQP